MASINSCKAPSKNIQHLEVLAFKKEMQVKDAVLLDVRTPEEVAEGSIPSHINIDYYADDFEDKIKALDRDKTYLIYCRSGARSADACNDMEKWGFKYLYNLKGGFQAYQEQ